LGMRSRLPTTDLRKTGMAGKLPTTDLHRSLGLVV
jgi:hypothetical protein